MWVQTTKLGAIIHTITMIYNISKFQAETDGWGIAISGDWGLSSEGS